MSKDRRILESNRKTLKDSSQFRSVLSLGNASLFEVHSDRRVSTLNNQQALNRSATSVFGTENDLLYELYEVEYSEYLLRALQNRVLVLNKKEKEENAKKCLVSLKCEYEMLLNNFVDLKRKLALTESYLKTIEECNNRIKLGNIVEILNNNKVDILFQNLSRILDKSINQLQLVDIQKKDVELSLGKESGIYKCLEKLDNFIKQNKGQASEVASEILQIQDLIDGNYQLRKRFQFMFNSIANRVLDKNYSNLSSIVNAAAERRVGACLEDLTDKELFHKEELLQALNKHETSALNSFQISNFVNMSDLKPSSTSTPQSHTESSSHH